MSTVIASNVLANGLRTEFADTYSAIRNRQADSRLGLVMDLSVTATNRDHDFAYFEAAPHMEYWRRGDSVPTKAMGSKTFNVPIYEWARRIPWSKFDRKDDQTQSLMEVARMAGESAALLPERFLTDLLLGTASTLPAVPLAPDGVAMFNTVDSASANRFGVTDGNLLGGNGLTNVGAVRNDYYEAIEQFKQFQDGQGQPLLSNESIDAGTIIVHAAEDTEIMEETFLAQRHGLVYANTAAQEIGGGTSGVDAVAASNLIQDAGRVVQLWGTSRLSTGDWYIFLKNPPKKATFMLNREGVQEFSSLEGDNNGDHTRDTGEEYVQWEERSGAGIALPFAAIKINN